VTKKILLKIFLLLIVLIISLLFLLPVILDKRLNALSEHVPFEVSKKAEILHKTLLIGDWHADSALWGVEI
tara:strand:+ start:337 stop:549 length:213 start_codon:yes stop_codon:yes gene_type:complete